MLLGKQFTIWLLALCTLDGCSLNLKDISDNTAEIITAELALHPRAKNIAPEFLNYGKSFIKRETSGFTIEFKDCYAEQVKQFTSDIRNASSPTSYEDLIIDTSNVSDNWLVLSWTPQFLHISSSWKEIAVLHDGETIMFLSDNIIRQQKVLNHLFSGILQHCNIFDEWDSRWEKKTKLLLNKPLFIDEVERDTLYQSWPIPSYRVIPSLERKKISIKRKPVLPRA